MTKQSPSFCSIACDEDEEHETSPNDPESRDTFTEIPSFNYMRPNPCVPDFGRPVSSTSSRGKQARQAFAKCRVASKDLLDDYLNTKREARRRSSCKEIILQLLRTDSTDVPEATEPRFRLIERKRRLTIANKLMESFAEEVVEPLPCLPTPPPNPFGSLTDTLCAYSEELGITSPPARYRSHSAEGYSAAETKARVNETKAFLFDSTPNLQDEIQKESFKEARQHRRNAEAFTDSEVKQLLEKLRL